MEQHQIIIYFILVSIKQFPLISSQVFLESGSFYHIRNALDSSYLRIDTLGSPCKNLGFVGTSASLNENSAAYRWKYIVLFEEVTFLDVEWTEHQLQLNEFSRYASQPHCYPLYRRFNITEVQGNLYKVQNVEDGSCLVSNGNGSQVSWTICNKLWSQQWEFLKV